MKLTKEELKKIIKEELEAVMSEEDGASWPSKAPKTIEIRQGSSFTKEQIAGLWKKMSSMSGVPKSPSKVLEIIGGIDQLTLNINNLAKNFEGSENNPARIDMPVVEPGKDLEPLKKRLAKGDLDFKEPFAPGEEKFPRGLDKADNKVQQKFLTKGQRDGSINDADKEVSLSVTPITVGSSYPTQKQVYLDKCLWNILNFGPTKPGGVAFGKPNLIAIQSGGKNLILDGHHRWASAWISGGENAQIRVQALEGLDAKTAIAALRSFGNAVGNAQKA